MCACACVAACCVYVDGGTSPISAGVETGLAGPQRPRWRHSGHVHHQGGRTSPQRPRDRRLCLWVHPWRFFWHPSPRCGVWKWTRRGTRHPRAAAGKHRRHVTQPHGGRVPAPRSRNVTNHHPMNTPAVGPLMCVGMGRYYRSGTAAWHDRSVAVLHRRLGIRVVGSSGGYTQITACAVLGLSVGAWGLPEMGLAP